METESSLVVTPDSSNSFLRPNVFDDIPASSRSSMHQTPSIENVCGGHVVSPEHGRHSPTALMAVTNIMSLCRTVRHGPATTTSTTSSRIIEIHISQTCISQTHISQTYISLAQISQTYQPDLYQPDLCQPNLYQPNLYQPDFSKRNPIIILLRLLKIKQNDVVVLEEAQTQSKPVQ
jgi:hypothetical protein